MRLLRTYYVSFTIDHVRSEASVAINRIRLYKLVANETWFTIRKMIEEKRTRKYHIGER